MNTPIMALSLGDLATQIIITVLVLGIYHVWFSPNATKEPRKPSLPQSSAIPAVSVEKTVQPVIPTTVRSFTAVEPKAVPSAIPLEIAAVIAAAVAVALGESAKVLSFEPSSMVPPHLNIWAMEGRMQIFHSHKVR